MCTDGGQLRQRQKDPRHSCYIYVPAEITPAAPDHHRRRLAALLLSSFAGTDGLKLLLSQAALAIARLRQPECMHIVAGQGADGKSMIFVDLLKAAFGSAFGNPACTLLQARLRVSERIAMI